MLVIPLIIASEQVFIPCAMGEQVMINCFGGEQISFWGQDFIQPSITLLSPGQGTQDTDGIIRFIFNPSDANSLNNCSLVYQGGIYTTMSNPQNDSENTIEVVSIDEQHPLYSDDLQWRIDCTDLFNNVGNSETRNLDTKEIPKGGLQAVIQKPSLNPKYINILYSTNWIPNKENIIEIEAFNKQNKLFKPENITFDFSNEFLNLTKLEIKKQGTIAVFFADPEIPRGDYEIIINVIDETTIERKIEVKIGRDIVDVVKTYKSTLRKYKTSIWIVLGVLIITIIFLIILIDRRRRKKKT